jgi:uncharacterized protein (TIGR00375 family)
MRKIFAGKGHAMRFIADFHIHSKYSRATSRDMEVSCLAQWARLKGIDLLGTGDFTHPVYLADLKSRLQPTGNGLFTLKNDDSKVHFMLTSEVSNIYHQGGKLRKIHTLIFAPNFELVEALNRKFDHYARLESDGRPIFTFPVRDLVKMIMDISDEFFIIPAHIWTPWFSLFGSNSGFESIEECFGNQLKYIHTLETGLSSDPPMNWRLSALDKYCLVSNSDAHSPNKIGREANVFDCSLDYYEIIDVLKSQDKERFLFTIEFYPEEGKYHYDGHRKCDILFSPEETRKHNALCPKCGRALTVGVMNRVDSLADRPMGAQPPSAIPCRHLVPLQEIIAEALGQGPDTKGVLMEYQRMIASLKNEFNILLDLPHDEIAKVAVPKIAEGIMRVREGKLNIVPGYDGVFGKVSIFSEDEAQEQETEQLGLF